MSRPDKIVRKRTRYGEWTAFVQNLESPLGLFEKEIEFISKMVDGCTLEWCETSNRALNDISSSLFSLSSAPGSVRSIVGSVLPWGLRLWRFPGPD